MQELLTQYLYTQEQEAAFTREIEARFGKIDQVLREPESPNIRVELCVIPGEEGTTLVTRGMGARAMNVPEELRRYNHDRAELVMLLPQGWDIHGRGECGYWPLRWLKLLARLPCEEDNWLGWGHTVPGGEPFAENTAFDSLLLLDAFIPDRQRKSEITLPGGEQLRLYQLFPLYPEELSYKLEHGAQALVDCLMREKLLRPVLDIARANPFAPRQANEKHYLLQQHQLRSLLAGWDGPDRCLATDRILVDGEPVGYCYREAPHGDWDSGWRFTAGDESDDYMDDPACTGVYGLNYLANYDEDILAILQTPVPCAFARGAGGLERLKNIL